MQKLNITLLIPTKDRPIFLKRLLQFINGQKNFNIIILDSSSNKKNKEFYSFQNEFKKKNIRIIYFKKDIMLNKKISLSLNMIKTKYVLLCPDDDFIFPNSVIKAKKFLEKNSNYICAHGDYYAHPNFKDLKEKKDFFFYKLYSSKNLEKPNPQDRLAQYLSKIGGIFPYYALYRTKSFKQIWLNHYKYLKRNEGFIEILPSSLSFLLGNHKVLPIIWMSKESNNNSPFDNINKLDHIFNEYVYKRYFDCLISFSKKHNLNLTKKDYAKIRKLLEYRLFKLKLKMKKKICKKKISREILYFKFLKKKVNKFFFDGINFELQNLTLDVIRNLNQLKKVRDLIKKYKLGYDLLNKNRKFNV